MEIWKDIKGYEGLYCVSNLGNIKSIKRAVTYSNGIISVFKERILIQETININYKRVTLSKNNSASRFQVHRLVALYFIPNPENKPCVNHIDGNASNNNVKNLEWCTYSENERHSYDVLGKINSNRKLNQKQVEYIRTNCIKGISQNHFYSAESIAKRFGVNKTTVLNVLKQKYYI